MPDGADRLPRVLSVQSHTVTGYVGNRCSVFTLQLLGLEADAINSVQFSNHGGYPTVKGQRLDGAQLAEIVDGMEANGLLTYDYLLTGYIGTASMLEAIADLVRRLRQHNPDLQYVCDPVMGDKDRWPGDEGALFLPAELVPLYRSSIVPLADILTPNCFEAEQLTGSRIATVDDALAACAALHERGPSTVVITSLKGQNGELLLLASTTLAQEGGPQRFRITLPRLDIPDFAGPGDLIAALLLGWAHRHPRRLQEAVVHAVAALQAVLRTTVAAAGPAARLTERTAENCRQRELRLIQSQRFIVNPPLEDFSLTPEALP